jgi:hypothetical protein
MPRTLIVLLASGLIAATAAACGSSSSSSSSPAAAPKSSSAGSSTSTGSGAGALSGEAASAATGDIPDNQVFLKFHNGAAGYSVSYPEGWARKGADANVTFADKNNIVHVVIAKGPPATTASVAAELTRLKQSTPTLTFKPPATVQLKAGTAVKAVYTTLSAANPVTGKRVLLIVDRYELAGGGRRAIVDLGTAKGVDNVDAYRLMINSFRWQ